MIVFFWSAPQHIYLRWRSTFLPNEPEITPLAVISHSIYRRSRAKYFLGRTRFQTWTFPRPQPLLIVVPIAYRSWVILGRTEKAFLRNCCGHHVFFYITFYDGQWLFLNYREYWRAFWEFSQRGLQNRARSLTSNALLTESCVWLFSFLFINCQTKVFKREYLKYLFF